MLFCAHDNPQRVQYKREKEVPIESTSAGAKEAVDPLILAVDAGTSSVRALVYDAGARKAASWEVHQPYAATTAADGGVTLDPKVLLQAAVDCIAHIADVVSADGRKIAAVACDTFWHSLMGVGRDGNPTTPILTWADTRSSQAAVYLREHLDEKRVHARTGAEIHSSYWPAKLLWLQKTQPDVMARTAYWMSFGEYLYFHLFGQRAVSLSMASGTGLFRQNECQWDQELLDALPIHEDQLSRLTDFTTSMTCLRSPFDGEWPQLSQIPWYLPVGDGGCNNIGSGGCEGDRVVVMVGTSGAIRVVRESPNVGIPDGIWTYRVDARRFVQGGALSAGGNVFAWLLKTMHLDDVDALEQRLARMTPDGHGLSVLPFLAGERSPYWNPRAESAIVGATLGTSPDDLVRASLEAIAYRFGLVFDILKQEIQSVRGIIGSGAGLIHSPAWMQIMTDVLAEPVTASAVPEATSRGAALLVLEAMGVLKSIDDAPIPLDTTYVPDPEHTRIYRAAMERQHRLYQLLTS